MMKPRGRPPVEERKDAVLSVRMTDAEYAAVASRAKAAREELADYARGRLISVNNKSVPHPTMAD